MNMKFFLYITITFLISSPLFSMEFAVPNQEKIASFTPLQVTIAQHLVRNPRDIDITTITNIPTSIKQEKLVMGIFKDTADVKTDFIAKIQGQHEIDETFGTQQKGGESDRCLKVKRGVMELYYMPARRTLIVDSKNFEISFCFDDEDGDFISVQQKFSLDGTLLQTQARVFPD